MVDHKITHIIGEGPIDIKTVTDQCKIEEDPIQIRLQRMSASMANVTIVGFADTQKNIAGNEFMMKVKDKYSF